MTSDHTISDGEAAHLHSARKSSVIDYLLINPPLTDPTQPYHSIPYLVGAARAAGFTGERCVDANVDSLNYLAEPDRVEALLTRAANIRRRIESQSSITLEEEMRYRSALAASDLLPDFVSTAISVFRDPNLFYHYPTYRQAVMAVRRWQEMLTLDGAPGIFHDFVVRARGVLNLCSFSDLTSDAAINAVTSPFDAYIKGPFAEVLRERPWDVIGFSVNYTSQLPFALRLAQEARSRCSDAIIVFGGTEVCDVVRAARSDVDIWELFANADMIVPGEGETPLSRILTAVRDGTSLAGIPGTMHRGERRTVSINYENVASLPAPAYDVWNWDAYWSPEPVVLYSPTRGCYWNKCTFCDYGLNSDRPTSPSRERPPETVMKDLAAIAGIGRTLYFAVDAMSPRYVRLLCQAMSESPIRFRWSAELRLERTFPLRGVAKMLRDAGCVAVSFGYESASQRVLDLIDKGVSIANVPGILADLRANGIAAEMMGFTGFPSETAVEAEQTYRFLVEHKEEWVIGGITAFGLTPGSIVAKNPTSFGIKLLPSPPNVDIKRFLPWQELDTEIVHLPTERDERIPSELRRAISRTVDDRPFVGGIDTAHTLLYFARNGRALIAGDQEEPLLKIVPETLTAIPFENIDKFAVPHDLESRRDAVQQMNGCSYDSMMSWLQAQGRAQRGESVALVLPVGFSIGLPAKAEQTFSPPLLKLILHSARVRGTA